MIRLPDHRDIPDGAVIVFAVLSIVAAIVGIAFIALHGNLP